MIKDKSVRNVPVDIFTCLYKRVIWGEVVGGEGVKAKCVYLPINVAGQ